MIGLKLNAVSRRFQSPVPRTVLNGIDLEVAPGEFLGLVGPSGVGKTTLLRIIAGLDRGFEGAIVWSEGRQPRLGVVFQEPRLVPWLSIIDNLLLVADQTARPEALQLLTDMELAGSENAFPTQLSGGMQRRASLARALLTKPDLLLLDEPLISLDTARAARLRLRLAAYWKTYRPTVLMVTHDLPEAVELSSRIVALAPGTGRIAADRRIDLPYPRLATDAAVSGLIEAFGDLTREWPKSEPPLEDAAKFDRAPERGANDARQPDHQKPMRFRTT
jgi:ABC-type nitrate/sulfonate/bicarbonate transport system ATPase subunit